MDNIGVDFVQDSETNIYEIHLDPNLTSDGNNTYSRTFEKTEYELLTLRKPKLLLKLYGH